jgi:hypothetical protein
MQDPLKDLPRIETTMHENFLAFGFFFAVETAVLPNYVPLIPLVPLEVYILLRLACISAVIILHLVRPAPKLWSPLVIFACTLLLLGLGGIGAVYAIIMLAFEVLWVDIIFLFPTLPFRHDRAPTRKLAVVNEGLWFVALAVAIGGQFLFSNVASWAQDVSLVGMAGILAGIWLNFMRKSSRQNALLPMEGNESPQEPAEGAL